ncbi:hypothetical protein KBB96_01680 [Luteolibacter ambystomatis]|uniref:Uncharacterized protein n=1 Tax=Luteolibacter ambystomatis TaxID=2824561 RepID=A0A975J082_9BACT|nr:hypothetical protein [Luteolibacter ambystomatis]QUE51616.1 hypothetical protein KBB96_01680 [Luteolibacter ambystomatis]
MVPQVIKLCCQGCGADLEVSEEVRFLTCNYCHSKLEVVRDVTSTHTRVLEKLERATDQIVGNLKVIELQNDLERLDREWESTRQSLLIRGQNGGLYKPSILAAVIGGGAPIIGGIVFATFAGRHTMGWFPLIGIVFSCFGFINLATGLSKASAFQNKQAEYERLREQVVRLIERERGV